MFHKLTAPDFQQCFEYFVLNFSIDGRWPYIDQIRELHLLQNDASNSVHAVIHLNLDHLLMNHWIPSAPPEGVPQRRHNLLERAHPEDNTENNHNIDDALATAGYHSSLHFCFCNLPLKYVPLAEQVCRNLYICLTCRGDLTSSTSTGGSLIWEVFTADEKSAQETKFLQSVLPPFQMQLLSLREPVTPIRALNASQVEKLVVVPGLVVQASRPALKASTLRIRCKQCGHQKDLRINPWRHGTILPRSCEANGGPTTAQPAAGLQPGTQPSCPMDPYYVVAEESDFVDVQDMKLQESNDQVPTGDVPRRITLSLTNSLVNQMHSGARIRALGVFVAQTVEVYSGKTAKQPGAEAAAADNNGTRRGGRQGMYLHVLGLQVDEEAGGLGLKCSKTLSVAEKDKYKLLAKRPDLIALICRSIAPGICGYEDTIKKSVACLLFGGSRKTLPDGSTIRGDLNVLLLGDPSTAKSQFLKFAEKAAPISVYTSGKGSSAAGLTAAVVRDSNGNFALEAGAMVLADGGVVCVDEFDKMRPDDRVAIHEAMEQQTVSIAKAGIQAVLKTHCSVLAAANPLFGSYDEAKDANEQHAFETTILSRFDCIWLVKDERNVHKDEQIAGHVFSVFSAAGSAAGNGPLAIASAMQVPELTDDVENTPGRGNAITNSSSDPAAEVSDNTLPLPVDFLRDFIAYARESCGPRLIPEAATKLQNFYVTVRKNNREDKRRSRDKIPIAVRQLESIARIAESFAKMALQAHVTVAHVDSAIQLFQSSTVAAASCNSGSGANIDPEMVKKSEGAILQRLAIGARANKNTIIQDLRLRGYDPAATARAVFVLIAKGALQEMGDAAIKRLN